MKAVPAERQAEVNRQHAMETEKEGRERSRREKSAGSACRLPGTRATGSPVSQQEPAAVHAGMPKVVAESLQQYRHGTHSSPQQQALPAFLLFRSSEPQRVVFLLPAAWPFST